MIDTLSYFVQDYVISLGLRMQRLRFKLGEYTAGYVMDCCKQRGIAQELNAPWQNVVSERDGRTTMNMVRFILMVTGMPKFLWGENL